MVAVLLWCGSASALNAVEESMLYPGVSAGVLRVDGEYLPLTGFDLSVSTISTTSGGSQAWAPSDFSAFWLSAGCKYAHDTNRLYEGYLEAGSWFLFSFGGGVTVQRRNAGSETGIHGFVGLPLPLEIFLDPGKSRWSKTFVEPYYRFASFEDHHTHEFGLYFKVLAFRAVTKTLSSFRS